LAREGDKDVKDLAATVCLLSFLAAPASAADLPQPVLDLQRLVGDWSGRGTLATAEGELPLQASWRCRRTSARFGVACNLHVTGIPGLTSYEETDLFGYEPNTDSYHWYSVTNAGETHDHVAQREPREFKFEGTRAGQPLTESIQLSFEGARVRGRAETFVAGVSVSVLSLALERRQP
jgi:hypothetical protein